MQKLLLILTVLLTTVAYSQNKEKDMKKFEEMIEKGDALVEAGKIKESIAVYTEALKIEQNNVQVLYRRAMAYFAETDFNNAVPDFSKLIELSPDKRNEAYFMRGLSKSQLKDPDADGCADLKKSKELGYSYDWEMLKMICPNL